VTDFSVTPLKKWLLLALSFGLAAFGQPANVWWLGLLAACCGYALFWRVLLSMPRKIERFYLAIGWFASVQAVQLAWAVSHPYLYIYIILLFVVLLLGVQWGVIAIWITPKTFQRVSSLMALAGLWTLLEWSRLFFMSGFPFNPIGLSLTGSIYPLQMASIGGVYLLSFWVMLTNLMALRAWIFKSAKIVWVSFACLVCLPYLFGVWQIFEQDKINQHNPREPLSVLLVQTAFPVEQKLTFQSYQEARQFVLTEWQQIFDLISPYHKNRLDLILLPENLVPYGTYGLIFPFDEVKEQFTKSFGEGSKMSLPPLKYPYADFVRTDNGVQWLVNNAFFSQGLANLFQAHVIIGLEDSSYTDEKKEESYSAALHFQPNNLEINRYEKRVLVPMGEYIPFESCRKLAAKYGVYGSFTAGSEAKLFNGKIPLGPSICYEEAFGHLMRDNRAKGAEMLVNLTNDGWYPHSKLPQQHFDHARLRTVENGIPLVRACNTGITGGIDSLGRVIGLWGNTPEEAQDAPGAIKLDVPTYHYNTLYTRWGDYFVVSLSIFSLLFFLLRACLKSLIG
jgi:apolipoprotein N-acyltransferase